MRRTSNLATNLKIIIVLSLLGVWAVPAPLATAQDDTLTGWFTFIVADYPSEDGLVSETTYILTEDSSARHELLIDIALLKPLGGPVALNRKRVTVMGEWEKVGPAVPEKFRVDAIELAASPSTTLQWEPFAADSFLAKPAPLRLAPLPAAESDSHIQGSQAWVTILCRFGDATDVTPHPVSHYEKMMGSSYPALGHYWREVSYGNIPNLNGSVVVGWYNLPRPRSYYVYDKDGDGWEEPNSERLHEDCIAAGDADVFFPDFWGINLIFNGDLGVSLGGSGWLTLDGQEQFYGVTYISRGSGISTVAHEMGHAFGLPHSSGPYGVTYDSQWDVMSAGQSLDPYPGYGHTGVHTIAYHKDLLGWIPPARKYVAPRNSTRTITLERLARPGTEGYLMAQIPIEDSPTDFYTVEARLFVGYDDGIPDEAIIIHKVDTTRGDRLAQVVDVDNNGYPNDEGAMWTVGEVFTDLENNLQVSIDAADATGFLVTINTNPDTFSCAVASPSPVRHSFGPGRGSASVQVMAVSGCAWSATSNAPWIRITSGGTGSGPGTIRYTVTSNPGPTTRTGTLTIAGWTFTVAQAGTNPRLFADNMESGIDPRSLGWEFPTFCALSCSESTWALTTASSRSGTHAWTDSPDGNYQNNHENGLMSPQIDLTAYESATLTFWHRYDFASGDRGNVEVQIMERAGEPIVGSRVLVEVLKSFTGTNPTWQQVSFDLSPFIGKYIAIRFILQSDASETADGWYIDDVAVYSSDFVAYDPCTYPVSSTSANFGPDGGNASVEVGASSGCQWTAESDSPWLKITEGRSGRGPGSVRYTVAANPNSTRTGTLTIDGWTFTVIQVGANDVLFEDDMESGTNGWQWQPFDSWALTTASSRSGDSCLDG